MSVSSFVQPVTPSDREDEDSSQVLRTHFLRRVAHDIASPAGVAITVIDELSKTEKARPELLAMARRSLRRLLRLSEQLSFVAELETGNLEPSTENIDIGELARKSLETALALDGRKDIVATSEFPPAPLVVQVDPQMLFLVIREAVGNALKLAGSSVTLSVQQRRDAVVVRVDDDGPGFSEEVLATVTKRFIRRDAARGLGLSLSMAFEIVRAHHGTLSIEPSMLPPGPRETRGAAVVMTLPQAR